VLSVDPDCPTLMTVVSGTARGQGDLREEGKKPREIWQPVAQLTDLSFLLYFLFAPA
jgi:hypothetical protein